MAFKSSNLSTDAQAKAEWIAAGRPFLPAVMARGTIVSVMHPSQLAALLDLEAPEQYECARLAWDLWRVVEDWLGVIPTLDWETLRLSTPSRGRTPLNLVVNALIPIAELPEAWRTGTFTWPGDHEERERLDGELERNFKNPAEVIAFAKAHASPFRDFVVETFSADVSTDRLVTTADRGQLPFSTLLASQRWHAGMHLWQIVLFLERLGHPRPATPCFAAMPDLQLPADPF